MRVYSKYPKMLEIKTKLKRTDSESLMKTPLIRGITINT